MADEYMSEFDYALPWWRRIVAHSESLMPEFCCHICSGPHSSLEHKESMIQLTPEAVTHLQETSQQLFSKLQTSVFWALIKDEPLIRQFMDALAEIDSQMKRQQAPPELNPEENK